MTRLEPSIAIDGDPDDAAADSTTDPRPDDPLAIGRRRFRVRPAAITTTSGIPGGWQILGR